jgi:hypothetical protein
MGISFTEAVFNILIRLAMWFLKGAFMVVLKLTASSGLQVGAHIRAPLIGLCCPCC